ncbi:MAG: hypothetical protein M1838_003135 [Thelocarpon superellum]|nr:MAG: hypothetical protein M1838_003135 [Thelocarpon superellum]
MATSTMPQDMHSLFDLSARYAEDFTSDAPLFDADLSSPHFTSINESTASSTSHNQGTVSPKDLVRDPQASAPPSTAFTNLTSPSIFDSPDVNESFETSPMFHTGDTEIGTDNWFSLFPGTTAETDGSPPTTTGDLYEQTSCAIAAPATRQRSSPRHSPHGGRPTTSKHSSVSGVSARKRGSDLPDIIVDDMNDTVAVKRARNTLAARKSRQKKLQRFDELESTIDELRGEVAHWKNLALSRNPGRG